VNGPILVAITGASGSIYGLRLVETLAGPLFRKPVGLVVSRAGRFVMEQELGISAAAGTGFLEGRLDPELLSRVTLFSPDDLGASYASGSQRFEALVIVPCTMNTAAAIAAGITLNLVHRLADVALKERRPLILVPREAPVSVTHLENLLDLARKGAIVLPASPAFYHRPEAIGDLVNFVVGKILDQLGLEHELYQRWQGT
jgi:flavin prenyltransferase